jgi:hypothetical protein
MESECNSLKLPSLLPSIQYNYLNDSLLSQVPERIATCKASGNWLLSSSDSSPKRAFYVKSFGWTTDSILEWFINYVIGYAEGFENGYANETGRDDFRCTTWFAGFANAANALHFAQKDLSCGEDLYLQMLLKLDSFRDCRIKLEIDA